MDDDPCLFPNKSRLTYIVLCLDDGFIVGKRKNEIEELLIKLSESMEITYKYPDQDKYLDYLRIKVHLKTEVLSIILIILKP